MDQARRAKLPHSNTPGGRTRLPYEIVRRILVYAVSLDQATGARLLVLSHAWHATLAPHVYTRVELRTAYAISTFCALVRTRPEYARTVRRLWIGPTHSRSDLLSILSLPMPGDSDYLSTQRTHVYSDTRIILRACRRLEDVALSGSLVAAEIVHSYGTACQPRIVTSINPHSFISGFDAPIFRRVHTLCVCDINLSFSEADAIRRMPALRSFTYMAPKDYGDLQQDVYALRKIVQADDPLESLERLRLDDSAKLHMTIRSVSDRATQLASALATFLQGASPVALYTQPLPAHFADEWDALRDLVFHAQGDYSRMALEDDVGSWVDPSHALDVLYDEWRGAAQMPPTSAHAPLASTPTRPAHT